MDTLDAILTRRSIRKYTDQAVSDELVTRLLQAAMAAPSARQRAGLAVHRDPRPGSAERHSEVASLLSHAQVCIRGHSRLRRPDPREVQGVLGQDCSAATQNLLLAATTMGLGAVWTGAYPIEDRVAGMGQLLNLPEHVIPLSLIPVGFPAERPGKADRFDRSRIHRDRW